jgi:hypothetical protein
VSTVQIHLLEKKKGRAEQDQEEESGEERREERREQRREAATAHRTSAHEVCEPFFSVIRTMG